jgi:gliding motility-associated-like protein
VYVNYTTEPNPKQTYLWSFPGSDMPTATGPGPYTLSWADSGLKKLSLRVDLEGCADTRTREINIHPVPTAKILHAPLSVACLGDKITLMASGGTSYYWISSDSTLFRSDSQLYTFQILHPATFHLQAANEWGCSDTDAYTITTVEPCCNFSYPNAFTPNDDGRNDRFRIITYGNQLEYELSIYNRWGQRVYYGTNPAEGWDGTFGGKQCGQDTYFYYLNAKCFTGHQETQKGEVMLLR